MARKEEQKNRFSEIGHKNDAGFNDTREILLNFQDIYDLR
jgi:hypothetical protein